MRYLDASIPLALMLTEPREKLSDIREIMLAVETGRGSVITSVFTVAEIIYVLERENKKGGTIKELVGDLIGCSGLKLVDANSGVILNNALEIFEKYEIDFIDAHHVATMKHLGIRDIYSLDSHYDRIKDITRLEKLGK